MQRCLVWLSLLGLALIQSGCGEGDSRPSSSADTRRPKSPPAPKLPSLLPPPPSDADQTPAPPPAEPAPPTNTSPPVEAQPAAGPEDLEHRSITNLECIAEAMSEYVDTHRRFPPAATYDADGRPLLSWRVAVLPWLGRKELYEQFHLDEPWDSDHNKALITQMPQVYETPGGPAAPKTCYLAPVGLGTVFSQREGMPQGAVRDGASNTLVVVEADADRAVIWTRPEDFRFIPAQPAAGLGSLREGKFLAAAGDANAHKIPLALEPQVLRALFTCDGREAVDLASLTGKPKEGAPAPPPDEGLLTRARAAMAEGREAEGIKYLLADAVVRGDQQVLGTLRWSPRLKRPLLAVRWGFAVRSSLPKTSPDGPPDGRIRPQRNPEGAPPDSVPDDPVEFWKKTVDEPLIERLQARVAEGYFGEWFQKFDEAPAEGEESLRRLPGMVVVEVTKPDQLQRLALEEGLDLVLIGDVRAKLSRRGPPQTVHTLQIVDMARNATLWSSKPLSNLRITVAKTSRRPGGDPAAKLIDQVMEYVDKNCRLIAMPKISRKAALQRAESLVSRKSADPLPVLMELRYYQWKGLLTGEELSDYYGKIVGPGDGPRLATGSQPQRRMIIERWLPREG